MEQQTKSLQQYYYYLISQNIVDAERLDGIRNHYKKLKACLLLDYMTRVNAHCA